MDISNATLPGHLQQSQQIWREVNLVVRLSRSPISRTSRFIALDLNGWTFVDCRHG